MKARRQHVSTCEGAELVWETFPLERGRKTSENRDLITNLKRVFLLSLSASVSGAESNKVKVAPVHISCTWKGCQEAPGSMRASLSAVLILRPRLGSLAQTHGAKRGHLTTPKPQLILFYHLYQVSLWRSAKSLAIIFIFLFFDCFLHVMAGLGFAASLIWNQTFFSFIYTTALTIAVPYLRVESKVELMTWYVPHNVNIIVAVSFKWVLMRPENPLTYINVRFLFDTRLE